MYCMRRNPRGGGGGGGETADVKCYRGVEDGISKEDERMC